jgi:hypothetical protein
MDFSLGWKHRPGLKFPTEIKGVHFSLGWEYQPGLKAYANNCLKIAVGCPPLVTVGSTNLDKRAFAGILGNVDESPSVLTPKFHRD